MSPSKRSILQASRWIGWALAAGLVLGVGAGVFEFRLVLKHQAARGLAEKDLFLDGVRDCLKHSPPPHPTWQDCEVRVRAAQ